MIGQDIDFALETLLLALGRAIAAPRDHQRTGTARITHADMQRRETTHAEADDMGLVDSVMIEHGDGVRHCDILAVERRIVRHIRREIAARIITNAAIAT